MVEVVFNQLSILIKIQLKLEHSLRIKLTMEMIIQMLEEVVWQLKLVYKQIPTLRITLKFSISNSQTFSKQMFKVLQQIRRNQYSLLQTLNGILMRLKDLRSMEISHADSNLLTERESHILKQEWKFILLAQKRDSYQLTSDAAILSGRYLNQLSWIFQLMAKSFQETSLSPSMIN
jgi:hypothetical protein